ncbi:MAG TPA: hypothetical protein VF116_03535 [Ktedonobacterales bacterium]
MQSNTFLILAYLIGWLGLLAYIGWVTLRLRGVRADLEAVRDLVERRENTTGG